MTVVDAPRLRRSWAEPAGLVAWFATVDHKRIGTRYMATALVFFFLGGLEAAALRAQLARPEERLLSPEAYDQLFSMHGLTMIFLFATPMLSGFGNYFVPLQIGARDMAFPKLNALGYWIFLGAGLFMYSGLVLGKAPNAGWFNYVPLSAEQFDSGPNIDFYGLGLIFLGISTTAGAINFIVTIAKLRAPGMSINRIPLFCWAVLGTSLAIVFAIPALTAASGLLELDRLFGFRIFDLSAGGNPVLWQHLFWIFGHPDVYIIFLPAVGIVSTIVPTFARRPMVAYTWMALATMMIAFLGFGVWVHHMFAVGLPQLTITFFAAASLLIAVPSGVQVFGWLATLVGGRPVLKTPLLYVLGFFLVFVIGGVTGVMFAVDPVRPAGDRLVLRRRALPLRALRRGRVPDPRGHPLLAAEDLRPDAERDARPGQLLARLRRLQPRVLPDAHLRAARDAAPRLHVPVRHGLGHAQPDLDDRRLRARDRARRGGGEHRAHLPGRRAGRGQPVGRADARVGDDVAAARRTTSRRFRSSGARCRSGTAARIRRTSRFRTGT